MAFEAKYDPIAMMNLAKARGLVTLEAEIRKVLSIYYDPNKHASEFDPIFLKLNGLKELARAYGVHLDPAMDEALGKLKQIHDNKSYEDHMKLILMHNYLTSVHHTNDVNFNPQAGEGRFYFRVGRDSLSYGTGPNAHSDLWEVFNLRKLMYSAESIAKDGTKGGFQGGLADIIKETWIYSLSRMRGFDLYSNVLGGAASTNDATIKARRDAYAHDLMTEEGRRMARQLGGAGSDNWTKILSAEAQIKQALSGRAPWRDIRVEFGDKGTPSLIKTLLSSLDYLTGRNSSAYFAKGIAASRVNAMFPQTFEGGAEIAYRERADLKKGQIPFMDERPVSIGDSREISPRIGFWKVDMKRIWETGHEATVGYYVDSIFGKGYKTPYKASIYREMMGPNGMIIDPATGKPVDPSNVSKRFAEDRLKPIYRRDTLMGEMYDFLNGTMAMNAYRYTNETVRFYAKAAQAILGGAVLDAVKNKRDGDPDYERAKAIFREIENLDVTTKEGGDRFAKILEKHAKQFNEFLNKPVTYDMMARAPHAWVMMHEGGYVPFIKGMPLSDFDRVMNGHVALKDSEGHWRRFDPQSMDMNFGTDASGMRFKREFAALQNQKDRHGSTQMMDEKGNVVNVRWDDFLTRMADWAKGDFAKQKIYNTVLWRYAQSTSDWNEFWEKSDITIRPKNEVLGIRIGALPFASHEEMSASVMEPFRKVREKLRDFGMWLELSSMYAGGRTYTASYDVTPVSELYREHYRDTAEQVRLIQSDLVGKNAAEKAAVLKNYGISEGMYNNMLTYARGFHSEYIIWNFGIDRAPQRHSTSYGLQNAMASSFQYGPAAAWDPRWYNAYFENRWASLPFTFAQGGVNLVRHLALPAITSFRTFQMNLFGYPNKWNYSDSNPMQPWDYRSPDALGAVRSVLNPFSASLNWFNFGDMQGEMIQRDTGGAKYRRGLASIPVEFSWIYKGITYAARRGDANPGLSTYDSRGTLGLTSAMAEYLAHRDQFAGYFGTDQNLQKRAHTTFIKREVGAPALALKREEELRGYSPLANPIHAWWNPVLFLWHLPISPVSPRDMYMHYKEGTRRMDWEDMSVGQKASQILGGGGGGMLPTMMAQIKPWYRDEEGNIKLYGMNSGGLNPRGDRKQIVYCQLCSSPMQRWGSCASCMKRRGGRA
jgi:hypothetical protein